MAGKIAEIISAYVKWSTVTSLIFGNPETGCSTMITHQLIRLLVQEYLPKTVTAVSIKGCIFKRVYRPRTASLYSEDLAPANYPVPTNVTPCNEAQVPGSRRDDKGYLSQEQT
jgi:hypothetical protein